MKRGTSVWNITSWTRCGASAMHWSTTSLIPLPGCFSTSSELRQYLNPTSSDCPITAQMDGNTDEDAAAYASARMPASSNALSTPCANSPLKPPAEQAIASDEELFSGIIFSKGNTIIYY